MYLHSIASRFPEHAFTQRECWDYLRDAGKAGGLRQRSLDVLEKILTGQSGIEKRHFCLADPSEVFGKNASELNRDFEAHAPALGTAALDEALDRAGVAPGDLDALFVCTCTGYLCPGVSSYVAEAAGLREDAYLHDLVGQGCGAAIPTLRAASHFLHAHPGARVAVVAVEVCSAAFYMDDDPGVLISLCLFGDGASASIWGGEAPRDGPARRLSAFDTVHRPNDRERIRFVNADGKLKNKLHRSAPALSADAVGELYARSEQETPPDRVISHNGGRDVLDAIEERLPGHDLAESRGVLRNRGNVSSPSLLFALERHLAGDEPGRRLWLTGFGAGFACHSAWLAEE